MWTSSVSPVQTHNSGETKRNPKSGETKYFPKFYSELLRRSPTERDELSMPLFQTLPAFLHTTWQKKVVCGCCITADVSLHIHVAVQVVIWAEKYLWPLHLSVHFALHLARVVPTPIPLNKDRLFVHSHLPTLCSTPNTSLPCAKKPKLNQA